MATKTKAEKGGSSGKIFSGVIEFSKQSLCKTHQANKEVGQMEKAIGKTGEVVPRFDMVNFSRGLKIFVDKNISNYQQEKLYEGACFSGFMPELPLE